MTTPKEEQKHTDLLPCPPEVYDFVHKVASIVGALNTAGFSIGVEACRLSTYITRKADCHEEMVKQLREALSSSIGAHEHVLVEAEAQPPRMDELHADGTYISRPTGKVILYKKRLERIRDAIKIAEEYLARATNQRESGEKK